MTPKREKPDDRVLLRESATALQRLKTRIGVLEREKSGPLAIIGMGCRLPGGADSPEAFWQLLRDGRDAVSEIPPERWDADEHYHPDPGTPGKMSTRWGGFLDQVDQFDADFFGISPREARYMDPQHRVVLEVAYQALEDAGMPLEKISGSSTGIFIGLSSVDYSVVNISNASDPFLTVGSSPAMLSGRLASLFNFTGPNMVLDTACSSSLVATHLACRSLRQKECSTALVGGVNVILSPHVTMAFSAGGFMSPDGRCKAFDARADGYVRAEGCGIIVLKRLEDALADGDRIWALIRGTAANQAGRSAGRTAPNPKAQRLAIEQALADGQVSPDDLGYVEAHGTGTPLGDPIEIEALSAVLGGPRADGSSCRIGSVKSNLGHLEAAAGITGVIKTALALRHEEIPAHLHFTKLSPRISLDNTPLAVAADLTSWAAGEKRRFAGVSSFGFSGTNAHVVLEEAPADAVVATQETQVESSKPQLLPLSARSPEALRESARSYRELLLGDGPPLSDVCFTAALRRTHHADRFGLVGTSREEMVRHLDSFLERACAAETEDVAAPAPRKLAFVFPGQGSQWIGMGQELSARYPVFREALERCEQAISKFVDWSLREEIAGGSRLAENAAEVTQPAIFAVQVALVALWRSLGIEPAMVVGHSMGEVAAAHVAGILSLEDAAQVICERSRLATTVSGRGSMLATELSFDEATAVVAKYAGRAAVAANNSPRSCLLAGEADALAEIATALEARQVFCRRIKVEYAAHSPEMDPLQPELARLLAGIEPHEATVPIFSTVTGKIEHGLDYGAEYWGRNLREPVLFCPAVEALTQEGYDFVEISPHPVLLSAICEAAQSPDAGRPALVLRSLHRDNGEEASLLGSLAELYRCGYPVAFDRLHVDGGRAVPLPTYPWQRQRYWVSGEADAGGGDASGRPAGRATGHPLLGGMFQPALSGDVSCFQVDVDLSTLPYLADHCVDGAPWLPAAAVAEMVRAAAAEVAVDRIPFVEELSFERPVVLSADAPRTLQLVLTRGGPESASVQLMSRDDAPAEGGVLWTTHAVGSVRFEVAPSEVEPDPAGALDAIRARCAESMAVAGFYTAMDATGLRYGPTFQGLTELGRGDGEAIGRVELEESTAGDATRYGIHPALLDAAFQTMAASLGVAKEGTGSYVTSALRDFSISDGVGRELWVHASRLADPAEGTLEAKLDLYDGSGRRVGSVGALRVQSIEGDEETSWLDWIYELAWRPEPRPSCGEVEPAPKGAYLAVAEDGPLTNALRERLTARGDRWIHVEPGAAFARTDDDRFRVNLSSAEECTRLLREAFDTAEIPCLGILHLLCDAPTPDETTLGDLERAQERGTVATLHLVQALAERAAADPPRLWLVTRGAQALEAEPARSVVHAPLWGLGKVIALEHPELRCTRVDLDPDEDAPRDAEELVNEILVDDREEEIALRGENRFVRRLVTAEAPKEKDLPPAQPAGDRPFRLLTDAGGVLDSIELRETDRPAPGPDELEIEVRAAGLNFKDVLLALNAVPPGLVECNDDGQIALGRECSGVVRAVGANVTDHRIGDEVVGITTGCFGRWVLAPSAYTVPKPSRMSFEEAAAVPLVFMTAHYALNHMAQLRSGERVLIHAAAGGVGQAAVQLAQRAGAEVLATAGSEEKREFLRAQGIAHVMDSRTLAFADEVMAATNGAGVDVVLNSLAGDAMEKSLGTLGQRGRFLEIGIRDILDDRAVGLRPFLRGLSYFAVELVALAVDRPELFASLLRETMDGFDCGELRPIPIVEFGLGEAQEAFRFMAQAKHIGKIVLTAGVASETAIIPSIPNRTDLRGDGTYLITGGLGDLGLEVARWMVERGARDLVLLGRSAPGETAREVIAELSAVGATVRVARGDVSSRADVQRVLQEIDDGSRLRGLIHAAGVLADGMLMSQTAERFAEVMAPKVAGAWNLHELTRDRDLDLFVLFSSAVTLIGSPGQANYVAANAFLDSLAHHRRAIGLAGLSINWGAWSDLGFGRVAGLKRRLELHNMRSLQPSQALYALGQVLDWPTPQLGILRLDLKRLFTSFPQALEWPLLGELAERADVGTQGDSPLRTELLEIPFASERISRLQSHLREQFAQVMGVEADRFGVNRPLAEMGLDSLMALELRNRLERSLGMRLSATILFNFPTIHALAPEVGRRMGLLDDPGAAEEPPPPEADPRHAEDLARIEALSDEEAEELLNDRLESLNGEVAL
ncbi:MAG: type I polyketide synthase [Candidatus Binatia bacterium]|nr:type I polyketide synthase [Candidatus Binatia bacterium]